MATGKVFKEKFSAQLSGFEISFKLMMGEYLVYCKGKHIGGLYDDRVLLKKTKTNGNLGLKEAVPYPLAKPMLEVDVADGETLRYAIEMTYKGINNEKS